MHRIAVIAMVTACTTPPLEERLDRADASVSIVCGPGMHEFAVSGTVVDLDGKPVAGTSIDLTTAWGTDRSFPANGCRLGAAVSRADGRFGPVMVTTRTTDPIIVALATGEGLAPTVADKRGGCLFGCSNVDMTVVTVPLEVATAWREELYAGGMEYALNRGLVAYQFLEKDRTPAARVTPQWMDDSELDDEIHQLAPDRDVRYLGADRHTLAVTGTAMTQTSGYALIGLLGDQRGYFAVRGQRATSRWDHVGVIVATGWIYFETGNVAVDQ